MSSAKGKNRRGRGITTGKGERPVASRLEGANKRENTRPTRCISRTVVARGSNGQPRTLRLACPQSPWAAYRRLVVAILALDVETLSFELRAASRALARSRATA